VTATAAATQGVMTGSRGVSGLEARITGGNDP